MSGLEVLAAILAPKNVTIFAQPPSPSIGFTAIALSQIGLPGPGKATLTLSETEKVSRRWTVVRNPVEKITAQNRIKEPKTLQITGMLSADPVFSLLGLAGVARLDRAELAKLVKILELSTCFVVTPEATHPNMACEVLDETYDEDTGRGVALSLSFSEFRVAVPGATEPELDLAALDIGAMSTTDLGATSGSSTPDLGGFV